MSTPWGKSYKQAFPSPEARCACLQAPNPSTRRCRGGAAGGRGRPGCSFDVEFKGRDRDEHCVLDEFPVEFRGIEDVVDLECQEREVGIVAVEWPIVRARGRGELNTAFDL